MCTVKSMGPKPTSDSKRLIGEGIWRGGSTNGCCYRLFRVGRNSKTSMMPPEGTWHARETGLVQYKLRDVPVEWQEIRLGLKCGEFQARLASMDIKWGWLIQDQLCVEIFLVETIRDFALMLPLCSRDGWTGSDVTHVFQWKNAI